jgi:disulfide bond formation protein DsbB
MLAPKTFYDVASARLDEQLQNVDSLDAKAGTALGFSAALLPVFGVLLAVSKANRPPAAIGLYAAALVVYALLLGAVFFAYQVRGWSLRPDLETLKENSEKFSEDVMHAWVARESLLSIAANTPRLKRKSIFTRLALGLLALDALLLAVAALIAIS